MHLENFPNCCSSLVVCGFGESDTAMSDYYADRTDEWDAGEEEYLSEIEPENVGFQYRDSGNMSFKEMFTTLREYIDRSQRCGFATIVAITDENQHTANEALMRAGFDRMDGARSRKHGTLTYLWRIKLQEHKSA